MPYMRGVSLDAGQLNHQLAIRGWQGKHLAEAAGLSQHLVSRARRGRPIGPESLERIARALGKARPLPGADTLTSRNEKPVTAAKTVTGREAKGAGLDSER